MGISKVNYKNKTLIDLTADTVNADALLKGCTAHGSNGELIVGKAEIYVKPAVEIVTWANGTEVQLAAMLKAHYAGTINIYDYWKVGDARQVSLSAMGKGVVGETHVAQTKTFVLMNAGGKTLENPINGKTECAFVVGQKNCLANGAAAENGFMNGSATTTGGWEKCARRIWCNDTYAAALPAEFRKLFKTFRNVTADGSNSTNKTTSIDKFALASEKEIFGSVGYANNIAEEDNEQFEFYKTSANIEKRAGDSGSVVYYWERSPAAKIRYFCGIQVGGTKNYDPANNNHGIAPFGCI
ncbi:MAG: DUF6273 domain-containing protein [Lachnospiraceae bacterium]|nr:DUF6273 domain-containing protein [Lachnospiraceae bacterium]